MSPTTRRSDRPPGGRAIDAIRRGARHGAVLAIVPGSVLGMVAFLASLPIGFDELITTPILWGLVCGVVVLCGAALGAALMGLLEIVRLVHRLSHRGD